MRAADFSVVRLDGSPGCWQCCGPVRGRERFCSRRCQQDFRRANTPTPDQIRQRRDAIKFSWSRSEERNRRFGGEQVAQLFDGWTPPSTQATPLDCEPDAELVDR